MCTIQLSERIQRINADSKQSQDKKQTTAETKRENTMYFLSTNRPSQFPKKILKMTQKQCKVEDEPLSNSSAGSIFGVRKAMNRFK